MNLKESTLKWAVINPHDGAVWALDRTRSRAITKCFGERRHKWYSAKRKYGLKCVEVSITIKTIK